MKYYKDKIDHFNYEFIFFSLINNLSKLLKLNSNTVEKKCIYKNYTKYTHINTHMIENNNLLMEKLF